MFKIILIISVFFFWVQTVQADTLVKIKTEDGYSTNVMSNGEKTRINMSPDPGFVLVNHKKNAMYIVIPEEKKIMNMTSGISSEQKTSNVKIQLEEIGNGPKIAGYSTRKFTLFAEKQDCGIILGSKEALENTGINNILNAVNIMMEKQAQMTGGFSQIIEPCERAEMNLSAQAKIAGFPMRTLDKNGTLTSEITSIDTQATIPADVYELPKNYVITTMADEMRSMQQQAPDMQQMMNQMGQTNQIPPDAMEQIKQMQEMMKQFQQ